MLLGSLWFLLRSLPSDSPFAVSGFFAQMMASLAVSNTSLLNALFSHDEPIARCLSLGGQYSRAVSVTYVTIVLDIVTDLFSIGDPSTQSV